MKSARDDGKVETEETPSSLTGTIQDRTLAVTRADRLCYREPGITRRREGAKLSLPHCFIKAGSDCAANFCAEQGAQAGAYPLRCVTA